MTLPRLSLIVLALVIGGSSAGAKDCGLPPAETPVVPDGRTATGDDIRNATQAVQEYAFKVQNYLNCMELNKEAFFLNMNDGQRVRWAEDYNALADKLTAIETGLNEQIRIYNERN